MIRIVEKLTHKGNGNIGGGLEDAPTACGPKPWADGPCVPFGARPIVFGAEWAGALHVKGHLDLEGTDTVLVRLCWKVDAGKLWGTGCAYH